MPRLARLDIAGLLQHVIVRGIERGDIFNKDQDRQLFAARFATLLSETGVRCYAWALLSNHFHLLLMPATTSLSHFMRRFLTGYAVSFNRRHKRSERNGVRLPPEYAHWVTLANFIPLPGIPRLRIYLGTIMQLFGDYSRNLELDTVIPPYWNFVFIFPCIFGDL